MNRYVYEVVTTNIVDGRKDSCYFSSRKAAERWKEQQERDGIHETTICQWKVFGSKDI